MIWFRMYVSRQPITPRCGVHRRWKSMSKGWNFSHSTKADGEHTGSRNIRKMTKVKSIADRRDDILKAL